MFAAEADSLKTQDAVVSQHRLVLRLTVEPDVRRLEREMAPLDRNGRPLQRPRSSPADPAAGLTAVGMAQKIDLQADVEVARISQAIGLSSRSRSLPIHRDQILQARTTKSRNPKSMSDALTQNPKLKLAIRDTVDHLPQADLAPHVVKRSRTLCLAPRLRTPRPLLQSSKAV